MPSVCFYFEVHQPYRLRPYGALQVGRDHEYFDDELNAEVLGHPLQPAGGIDRVAHGGAVPGS